MKTLQRSLVALLVCCSACAVNNKYALQEATVSMTAQGEGPVAIAAHDQRRQVIDGADPRVVGVQRAGFGNPFNVTTESGQPLAPLVAQTLSETLTKHGFSPSVIETKTGATFEQVLAQTQGSPKAIIITIAAFWSDTYTNVGLTYDLTLTVVDARGAMLARSQVQADKEDLGGSAWNPPKVAKRAVPAAFARLLGKLLSDPAVAQALSSPVQDSPPAGRSP